MEVRGHLRAAAAGEHVHRRSGLGRSAARRSTARSAFDEQLELAPGADPVEAHMRPPQHGVPVVLDAGQEVALVLRHEPPARRGHRVRDRRLGLPAQRRAAHAADEEELARAVAAAAGADVAVVVVGTTEEVESEGFDRESLALPGRQDELVRRVAAANPRTVVVVNAGAPVLLPWADEVAAVLLAWFPGQEFGHALADVLLGDAEPGGRLPTTWPAAERRRCRPRGRSTGRSPTPRASSSDTAATTATGDAAYRFGHGLGYTTWEYARARGATPRACRSRVRNIGARRGPRGRAGLRVAVRQRGRARGAVARRVRVGQVEPGEEATMHIALTGRHFAHWDVDAGAWQIEPGTYRITTGPSSAEQGLITELTVDEAGRMGLHDGE